ncbi:hypothetical protein BGX38DRAFT_1084787, partial [Terfezia claveryi]
LSSIHYLPPVKPSAIALGTLYTHATSLAVMTPLFGETYHKVKTSNSKEEFLRSKEAASAATAYGSSLVGSAIQTYGIAALLNSTGTLTYKGAAYMGGLIFAATTVPSLVNELFQEKRPADFLIVKATAAMLETVGLSILLTWWGTRPSPF